MRSEFMFAGGGALLLLAVALPACSAPTGGADGDVDAPAIDAASRDGGPDAPAPACVTAADCDDHIDCTMDACVPATGSCRHTITPALCASGESCNPMTGCTPGRPCATSSDCADMDACTTMEMCDPRARVCTFVPLDGDGDGSAPRVCGGADCDDSDPLIYGGAAERCNTFDDDCDGRIDEGLESGICAYCGTVNACHDEDMSTCYVRVEDALTTLACGNRDAVASAIGACASSSCSTYASCRDAAAAMCACTGGRSLCGGLFGACLDTTSDTSNCGSCGHVCPFGTSCSGRACVCPTALMLCSDACVDTTTDAANCGSCAHACGAGEECVAGACRACGSAGGPCCAGGICADRGGLGANICMAGTCVGCGFAGEPCCTPDRSAYDCSPRSIPRLGCASGTCSPCVGGYVCPDGVSCGGSSDPWACGPSCTACPAPANATATCTSGVCDFTCDAGYTRSGSTCTHVCASEFSCNPLTAMGCPAGQGCYLTDATSATCATAGAGLFGAPCTSITDCAAGLECVVDAATRTTTCRTLCCGSGDDARCRSAALGGMPTDTCTTVLAGTSLYLCTRP